jgi:hypothetical protein
VAYFENEQVNAGTHDTIWLSATALLAIHQRRPITASPLISMPARCGSAFHKTMTRDRSHSKAHPQYFFLQKWEFWPGNFSVCCIFKFLFQTRLNETCATYTNEVLRTLYYFLLTWRSYVLNSCQ